MILFISLTHNCQLRCDYCYAGKKYHKPISKETILKSIAFMLNFPIKELTFGFFGGEPLLEWKLLQFATYEMEKEAEQRGIILRKTFTTNGVLLDDTKVAWLHEHAFYIIISMDGNEQMHNRHRVYADKSSSFQDVKAGLFALQKVYSPKEYSVISVVTPKNISFLNESVRYFYEVLHIKNIRLSLNYFTEEWSEETEEYSNIYHELGVYVMEQYRNSKEITIDIIDEKILAQLEGCSSCSFGEMKIAVAPSGTIYPCERLIGEDSREMSIGNVYKGFDLSKRNALIAQRGNSNAECKSCELKERCTNSCGCTNYTLTNSISTTNGVVCFFQKLFIEVADEVATTLYKERNEMFLSKFYGNK